MQILVDADTCPVKQIIVEVARKRNIPVTMFIDTSHELEDSYSTVITVDKHKDSVDFALLIRVVAQDIVVTQDFGLAAMALAKGAKVVNQNGLVFTDTNIDSLMMDRYMNFKKRQRGIRTKGYSKRTKEDDNRFKHVLEEMIYSSE